MKKINIQWVYISVIFIFSFLVYFSIFSNEFVYDDVELIRDNPYISDISNFTDHLFDKGFFEITGSRTYRPVAEFSYFFLYSIFGNNTFPFHFLSILLHALNGIMLFLFLLKVSGNKNLSMVTVLLFICYPAISEAVILITYNDELLTFLFFLLSLVLYITDRRSLILLSFFTFILALLSKEMAITLPIIIILYDLILNEKSQNLQLSRRIKKLIKSKGVYYAGYILIAVLYIYIRFFYEPLSSPKIESADTASGLLQRVIYIPYQYFQFLKISIFPLVLNADRIHSYPENFFNVENLTSVVIFLILIYSAIKFYKKHKFISFGILWFFATLLPIINIIPHGHPIAERYLYLSSVGFLLILSWVIIIVVPEIRFSVKFSYLNTRSILFVLVLLLFTLRTVLRTGDWKDSETIWKNTLVHSPNSFRAYNNLGNVYLEKGLIDKALDEYRKSIELNPKEEKTYLNQGNALVKKRLYYEAIRSYKNALKINPDYIQGHLNLGVTYVMIGNINEAIDHWQKVLEIDPENKAALENMQKARQRMRR